MDISIIREVGILYILLVIAITMHEYGHAFIADKLGDPLPRIDGRVTINPIAHMDMLGTVILPLLTIGLSVGTQFPLVFGWGKPVRVALDNPKTRAKVDILSTAGGVGMNLVLALIFAILLSVMALANLGDYVAVAQYGIFINCALFVINMIPVPPLDGSKFLKYATKMSDATYYSLARWGLFIFLAIIMIPQTEMVLRVCIFSVSNAFIGIAQFLFNLFS